MASSSSPRDAACSKKLQHARPRHALPRGELRYRKNRIPCAVDYFSHTEILPIIPYHLTRYLSIVRSQSHSGSMPAAFTTRRHFSISDLM